MVKSTKILDSLKKLLIEGAASTQEDIKQHLTKLGFEVNQAKISRLLRKLGAVKTSNDYGQVVYCLPKEPGPPKAKSALSNLVIDIECNETVIVVHTSPGSAAIFGRVLDYNLGKLNILGTVAGDDTIIIVPRTIKEIQKTLVSVRELLLKL
jgi:transcriptional regulator of arginine metabolism